MSEPVANDDVLPADVVVVGGGPAGEVLAGRHRDRAAVGDERRGAGLLSVLVFPAVALGLLGRSQPVGIPSQRQAPVREGTGVPSE